MLLGSSQCPASIPQTHGTSISQGQNFWGAGSLPGLQLRSGSEGPSPQVCVECCPPLWPPKPQPFVPPQKAHCPSWALILSQDLLLFSQTQTEGTLRTIWKIPASGFTSPLAHIVLWKSPMPRHYCHREAAVV